MTRIAFLPIEREDEFENTLAKELASFLPPGATICIKLHFGEPGNKYALSIDTMKAAVSACKSLDLKPFLFDSPVMYTSPRGTIEGYYKHLEEKGITEETMGCPVIISDEHVSAEDNGREWQICKHLVDADGVLILSHLKGHLCSGFGGAIKNIGMGGMSKATKTAIHKGAEPKYVEGCQECNLCVESCPLDNVRLADGRPHFDANWCCGCSNCVIVCEHDAIKPKVEIFDKALVTATRLGLELYKKIFYVNVIKDVMKLCDCASDPGPRIADDIGIVFGTDIVAIEKASLDLVIEKAGSDVFLKAHHKSPLLHIREAERQGLGSMEYELECV